MMQRTHHKSMASGEDAYEQMFRYQWPGNVRELENIIARALILKPGGSIEFVSFVKKYQPQYNETELARMPGISRKNLWEKRQRLEIPARKQ